MRKLRQLDLSALSTNFGRELKILERRIAKLSTFMRGDADITPVLVTSAKVKAHERKAHYRYLINPKKK